MTRKMHLNAFTQCSICHHSKGQWKHPLDRTSTGYRDVGYWVDLARTLERGCFDSLFLADVHGTYDVYKGSRETAVKHAVQIPGNDPTVIIPAMAHATSHLGFACTYSTTYFPPYQTAKLFSSLDHLSDGRVAWNVVTSYLNDANKNFGITEPLPHDQRYDRADEYMDVVYKLWEHSWEEDAIVRDVEADTHTDPAKVHEINHVGEWFNVPGPHMCEPSPQRTPVIFQAGQSGRGNEFAARHAEAIFCIHPNTELAAPGVKSVREAVAAEGRAPDDVKIIQGVAVIVAPTDEEARLKERTCRRYASPEGVLALFSGWAGIDMSELASGKNLEEYESNAIQGVLSFFSKIAPDREWTVDEIGEFMAIGSLMPKIVGSPATVADELERWMAEADVDGFNVHAVTQPAGFEDFVDLVVPELQRRGRLRTDYEGSTLRESFFGAGRRRLPETHVAHRALPPWRKAGA
ncbi:LLM class flavin-dependent oxidoreductase [Salinisphaera sp. PC39]|uniref:LLM class flavin-dependent oxidoreductase n=1 Tax=Salinisphaera sp. PC39 TaxID=1304156 RepID=UPI003342D007